MMKPSTVILSLDHDVVYFLRKTLTKIMPPACWPSVFSRQAVDVLQRRIGDKKTQVKTAQASKEISYLHCLLLEREGEGLRIRLRGWTDRGCPIWVELKAPGALAIPSLAIDPAVLFVDPDAVDLSIRLTDDTLRGAVRTVTSHQGGEKKKCRVLLREEADVLSLGFTKGQVRFRDEIKFTGSAMRSLRHLSLIAGVTDHPSWLTVITEKEETTAVWRGGPNVLCCLRDRITSTRESLTHVSPGNVRFLRWALGLAGERQQMESLTLDGGERGGSVAGKTKRGYAFRCTFLIEEEGYKYPKTGESESRAYLTELKQALRDKASAKTVNLTTLSQALGLGAAFLQESTDTIVERAIAVGRYGESSKGIAVTAKGERSLRVAYEGLPSEGYPIVLLEADSAAALSRLIRVYAAMRGFAAKDKETLFRTLSRPSMEGVALGEDGAFSFLVRTRPLVQESFRKTQKTDLQSVWRTDTRLLDKILKVQGVERLPAVRRVVLDNPATLGEGMGVLIGKHGGRILLGSGGLNLLTRVSHEGKGEDGFVLVPKKDLEATVAALKRLDENIPGEKELTISLKKVGRGGLALDFELLHDGKSLGLSRIPYASRRTLAEALDLLNRGAGQPPVVTPRTLDSMWALPLRKILETTTLSPDQVLEQKNPAMAALGESIVKEGEVLSSDRLSVSLIPAPPETEGLVLRQSLLSILESLGGSVELRNGTDSFEVRQEGVSVLLRATPLDPKTYPEGKIREILARPEGEHASRLKALLQVPALLEVLPEGTAFWVWHRSGRYLVTAPGDMNSPPIREGKISLWEAESDLQVFPIDADRLRRYFNAVGMLSESQGTTLSETELTAVPGLVRFVGSEHAFLMMGQQGTDDGFVGTNLDTWTHALLEDSGAVV